MEFFQNLPMEIVNKILLFVTNPIADMFRKERYYGRPFPFLYCERTVVDKCSEVVRQDYDQIKKQILKHRHLSRNFSRWKYRMFHIHSNHDEDEYYYGSDKLYILDMPRFRNEIGLWEVCINLWPIENEGEGE